MVVDNVLPDSATSSTVGCSFGSTHNYVVVEAPTNAAIAAHGIGHACWLEHDDDSGNLMWPSTLAADPTLSNWQISLVRWSTTPTSRESAMQTRTDQLRDGIITGWAAPHPIVRCCSSC